MLNLHEPSLSNGTARVRAPCHQKPESRIRGRICVDDHPRRFIEHQNRSHSDAQYGSYCVVPANSFVWLLFAASARGSICSSPTLRDTHPIISSTNTLRSSGPENTDQFVAANPLVISQGLAPWLEVASQTVSASCGLQFVSGAFKLSQMSM